MVSFCCRSSADPLVFVSSETRSAGIYFPEVGSTLVWILGEGGLGKGGRNISLCNDSVTVKHPKSLVDLSGCAGKRELTQRASPGGSGWLPAA